MRRALRKIVSSVHNAFTEHTLRLSSKNSFLSIL